MTGAMSALGVALAGAAGSLARYGIGTWLARGGSKWPLATFAVNVLGSFLIGLVLAVATARGVDPRWRVVLTAGFLGGFTTFSAFAYEATILAEEQSLWRSAVYVGATVIVGLLACAAGIALGRALR